MKIELCIVCVVCVCCVCVCVVYVCVLCMCVRACVCVCVMWAFILRSPNNTENLVLLDQLLGIALNSLITREYRLLLGTAT